MLRNWTLVKSFTAGLGRRTILKRGFFQVYVCLHAVHPSVCWLRVDLAKERKEGRTKIPTMNFSFRNMSDRIFTKQASKANYKTLYKRNIYFFNTVSHPIQLVWIFVMFSLYSFELGPSWKQSRYGTVLVWVNFCLVFVCVWMFRWGGVIFG